MPNQPPHTAPPPKPQTVSLASDHLVDSPKPQLVFFAFFRWLSERGKNPWLAAVSQRELSSAQARQNHYWAGVSTLLSNWNTPYTFSGKEKDEEIKRSEDSPNTIENKQGLRQTGYSYFGARYYDSDLSLWLSVDPLSDEYPGTSPFMYVRGNPVMLIDPNGMNDDEWNVIQKEDGTNELQWVSGKGGSKTQIINYSNENSANCDITLDQSRGNRSQASLDVSQNELINKFSESKTLEDFDSWVESNGGFLFGIGITLLGIEGSALSTADDAASIAENNKYAIVKETAKQQSKFWKVVGKGAGFLGRAVGVVGLVNSISSLIKDPDNGSNWVKLGANLLLVGTKSNPITLTAGIAYSILETGGFIDKIFN